MTKEIFISAGDPSADLHASNLAHSLRKLDSEVKITSLGGKKLAGVSDEFLYDIVGLDVHGFYEPIKQYFKLRNLFYTKVTPHIKKVKPKMVVLVDYYGFNIHIAEYAHSLDIPVYYFISPQVWATRHNRIKRIKKCVSHMLVIFPFEKEIYQNAGIPVTFVGHPLLDMIPEEESSVTSKDRGRITVGLFPGSRKPVIKWNLPIMEKAAKIIREEIKNVEFIIMGLSELKSCYKTSLKVAYDTDYLTRRHFTLALTTSGTVTLENALLGIPMIVLYHLPFFMYFIIKSIVHVSNISIVNLIVNRQIVPEFIQHSATPENIAGLAVKWLRNPEIMENIKSEFAKLPALLGQHGAVDRTAKIIIGGIDDI